MKTALIYVACSVGALLVLILVYTIEDAKGTRIFLKRFRAFLDSVCLFLWGVLKRIGSFFGNRFVRLLLHYSLHSILKRTLTFLQGLESKVEALVRKNRKIAKSLTAKTTRTHLDEIAEHKEEVALTEKQKEKLLSHD